MRTFTLPGPVCAHGMLSVVEGVISTCERSVAEDGRGVGGRGVPLSTDAPGIHLQMQKVLQNTS